MSTSTATVAPRQRKPRAKPVRSIRLCVRPSDVHAGVVSIRTGKDAQDYLLTDLPSDFGRGFTLHKIGHDEDYHVNLNGRESLCDCKGFHSAKNGFCKHIDGLQALVNAGRI